MEDSKSLRRLPTPRSLSLLFEQYNKYEEYNTGTNINSFAFFLFQVFSHDIQHLVKKTACGDNCFKYTGCNEDGSLALVDTLRTDSVDVMHVCSADPFYGFYGRSCVTSPKLQNLNSDCKIRRAAPVNVATRPLDLSHLYNGEATLGPNGEVLKNGILPYISKFLFV